MKSVTIDDVMAWGPCNGYTRERVTELFAGRESVTALDILDMDIPNRDKQGAFLQGSFVDDAILYRLERDWIEHLQPLFKIEGQWRIEYIRKLLSGAGY